MKPDWNFPSNNFGQESGLNDAGIETFMGRPLASLAREILQNSQDAADVSSRRPVEVHFKLHELPVEKFPGRSSLGVVLEACKDFWINNKKTNRFFTHALVAFRKPKIQVLKISDYNTTGLTGSDKEHGTDWHNLIKAVGASDKGPAQGGSFGIGKHAPFACAQLRTVFYGTKDLHGNTAFQGVAKLVTHKNKKKRENTQGTGYFGSTDKNQPITDLSQVDEFFRRNKIGTDIFVAGFSFENDWIDKVIKSVIENFFVAIHEGKLVVNVEGTLINTASLPRLIEKYIKSDNECSADKYFEALISPEGHFYKEDDFEGLGSIELNILPGNDFPKRVAMVRTGMVVYHKGHFRTPLKFAGVFVAKGAKINEFLRSLEPPSHDDWQYERHDERDYARDIIKKLNNWIGDCVKQLSGSQDAEQLDAEGLSQYLPDDLDDVPPIAEQQKPEGEKAEPKPIEIQTRMALPAQRVAEPAAQAGLEGDEGATSVDGVEEGGGGGAGPFEPGGGGPGDGGADPGTGNVLNARKIPIKLKRVRIFCTDASKGTYRVNFEPDLDGNGFIVFSIVGEVGEDKAELISVRRATDGQEINIAANGEVGPFIFLSGKQEQLEIVLKDNLRCAMEVSAHAN